jgi:hypothetical protein
MTGITPATVPTPTVLTTVGGTAGTLMTGTGTGKGKTCACALSHMLAVSKAHTKICRKRRVNGYNGLKQK